MVIKMKHSTLHINQKVNFKTEMDKLEAYKRLRKKKEKGMILIEWKSKVKDKSQDL